MNNLSPNLQHLTNDLPAKQRADIEAAIASSPHLRQIMTEAVNAGTLEHGITYMVMVQDRESP